ncbi:MAG: hypothetical protein R3F46_01000 [bacterium]
MLHDDRWRGFFAELLSRPPSEEEAAVSADMLITRHGNLFFERRYAELLRELEVAERRGNLELVQELTNRMIDTKKRIRPVQGIGGTP